MVLLKQIINFLNNKIIPVYVFDGVPITEKSYIIKSRRNKKFHKLVEKINKLKK